MNFNDKELEESINKLEKTCSKDNAYFGSSYNEDFGYAKGNRDGLILYAVEFLKAAADIKNREFDESDKEMYNPDFKWIKGVDSNPFRYIQVTTKKSSEVKEHNNDVTWRDKLIMFGCLALVVFCAFLAVVGLVYFVSWF